MELINNNGTSYYLAGLQVLLNEKNRENRVKRAKDSSEVIGPWCPRTTLRCRKQGGQENV